MWACHRPNGRRSKIFRNAREISRHNCGASPTALITPEVYGQLLLTRSLGALLLESVCDGHELQRQRRRVLGRSEYFGRHVEHLRQRDRAQYGSWQIKPKCLGPR